MPRTRARSSLRGSLANLALETVVVAALGAVVGRFLFYAATPDLDVDGATEHGARVGVVTLGSNAHHAVALLQAQCIPTVDHPGACKPMAPVLHSRSGHLHSSTTADVQPPAINNTVAHAHDEANLPPCSNEKGPKSPSLLVLILGSANTRCALVQSDALPHVQPGRPSVLASHVLERMHALGRQQRDAIRQTWIR